MNERIQEYVRELFEDAPRTKKAMELQEEIAANLNDKYNDLVASGMAPNDAYNAAVAGVGDVSEMFADLSDQTPPYIQAEQQRYRRRSAVLVSIAVVLYILSVIPVILAEEMGFNEDLAVVPLLAICAVATGLLIFNFMSRPRYQKMDDTMVKEFHEWKQHKERKESHAQRAVISALWLAILAVYFIVSFATFAWHVTWIIFLVGAAVDQIIRAVFALSRHE